MDSSSNPRRVPMTRLPHSALSHGLSHKTVVLRKGATFHSPTNPFSDSDSSFYPVSLPRAQSNLDDVVDAHRRRAALALESIDRSLASIHISSDSPSPSSLAVDDDLSVPKGILDHTITTQTPSLPPTTRRIITATRSTHRRSSSQNHHHASDSGLGSSIESASMKGKSAKRAPSARGTAVTRSVAAVPSVTTTSAATGNTGSSFAADQPAGLSVRATSRIYEHTVKPLLAKPTFKAFHPLLLECTTKINKRDIVCLRDLEKTILFLAPDRTKSAKLYVQFCLESIHCLQATVEYLTDREQTRPSDQPYTAGYFIDLVEQIRHYAQQLADAKEKEKSGITDADTMDHHRSDEIKLHGGITVNGRPAELVRISRDGRAVSIATGLPVELEEDAKDSIRIKRSASQELEDEEEIMRSMARRKKNAPPEEYAPKQCSVPGCTKEFKRPCDLTKHEKTHSRPWKCPIPSCKYHDYGWPTEKEKERHMNDKHSDNPAMYECLFKPCTYKSKRDSNRKQHMEKTHGWTYVRTKTNGSGKTPQMAGAKDTFADDQSLSPAADRSSHDASSTTQATPQLVNMLTPVSAQSPAALTPPLDEFSRPLFAMDPNVNLDFPTCAMGDILPASMQLPTDIDDMDFMSPPLDLNSPGESESSLDNNNSAYQDLSQDATMFGDIYSAMVQLPPTPEEAAVFSDKNVVGQFLALSASENLRPMFTPQQSLQIQRLQQLHQQQQQQELQLHQHQQQHQRQHQHQHQHQQYSAVTTQGQQMIQPQGMVQPTATMTMVPQHFSPLGEGNTMLFTPDSLVEADEGFVDFPELGSKKDVSDFVLFPTTDLNYKVDNYDMLFEDLAPSVVAGYSQPTTASQIFSNQDW